MGFDSRRATGPLAGAQRQAFQHPAAGRRRGQDAFGVAQEQMAQVQEMGRRMRTHRPSLRKVFAATELQATPWRPAQPAAVVGQEHFEEHAWRMLANRTMTNFTPNNPAI